ncbi:major facilitator superfamily domain-containing protein [Macrophomina phaseolina]|uniref:Major facilitator superfamily domain-containing protein n=1 Tax=Macrophomina phaseolina TaxID=35725 RepID=A0ABQ8GFY9_9PEZI|nr:major facilitator superfamily domain-containing protein [Macrophomina phaseolina]
MNGQIQDIGGIFAVVRAGTSFRPFVGALSDSMGRRRPILACIALFAVGSAIGGSSINMAMLIAGMAVQGLGGCGISVLCQILVCDLVGLRRRAKYCGFIYGAATVGYSAGPVVGGLLVERAGWRWCYYITLAPCGLAAILVTLLLRVNHIPHSAREVFSRMDWRGNVIFVAACVSSVLALGWAGTIHPWGSIEVLLPLLPGLAGFAGFVVYEAFAPFPMLPPHMFRNRNFVASWTMSFASGLGVLASSPAEAGVQYLPAVFATTFSALAGGQLLSKTGDYKSIHIVCAAIQTAGAGLMSTLDERSPTAMWVVFRMIAGIGPGALGATVLPAAQAALSPSDVAKSAAALAFGQSLGSLWGLAVPAAVFNGRAQQLAHRVQDPIASRQLSGGQAYSRATKAFLDSLSVERGTRAQTVGVFVDSLRLVWYTQIGLSALCFVCLLEKRMHLGGGESTDTSFGLKRRKPRIDA